MLGKFCMLWRLTIGLLLNIVVEWKNQKEALFSDFIPATLTSLIDPFSMAD